jgi:competence protein ComEC
VDVGAGLCVVVAVPTGQAMLYDAGRGGDRCGNAVRELVLGRRSELVILSHSDVDHIRELPRILGENRATTIIHPGDPRGPALVPVRAAIAGSGATVIDLSREADRDALELGHPFQLGAGTVTFIAGWHDGHETEGPGEGELDGGPLNNALSIVVRLEFGGHSVLLTGDSVGRLDNEPNSACQYAERIMVERAGTVPIDSDVLVGQHHGANNSTSNCFIRAVSPDYVVFSAGHHFRHPRQAVVDRLVANGVDPTRIFRTDRGDNEGGSGNTREMLFGSLRGCHDQPGDDDVEIRLPANPSLPVRVSYRVPSTGC